MEEATAETIRCPCLKTARQPPGERSVPFGMSRIRRFGPETADRSLTADALVREEPDDEEDEQDEGADDNQENHDEGYSQ